MTPFPAVLLRGAAASGEVTADIVQYQRGSGSIMLNDGSGALALVKLPRIHTLPAPCRTCLPGAQGFMHERAIAVAVSGFDGQDEPQYANTDPLLFGFWAYEVTPDNIIWGAFALFPTG